MAKNVVKINRAPVMTLWAAVVAERLGFDRNEALALGKTVAGLNAQAKGRSLGIFKPAEKSARQERVARKTDEDFFIELLGRAVPARKTKNGIRAIVKDTVVDPSAAQRYLAGKFGDRLDEVRSAMEDLARAYEPKELAERAYGLYERFRPQIAGGTRGWGQAGDLDLDLVRSLAREA
jgi:hypothetical protein